jgi:hypothetical protein
MELPKIDVEEKRLAELLNDMKTGELQVPRFQRDFVWPLTKTRELLDSMYKEFPIGTFFLWRAPGDTPPLFRSLQELGIPTPRDGQKVTYILDGQQRLASLYAVVNGITVDGRDYGRISIDLDTATRYEQNTEEGFEEPIFIHRRGDNERYVSVRDLLSSDHLVIYNAIREDWKPVFNKAYQLFHTYPFSVVWVQGQNLGDAIVIFQRINQAGKRLSRYDLVCANLWTEDFDFRKRVADLNRAFESEGFGALDETIYTQTLALVQLDRCTTGAELSLQTDAVRSRWDRVVRSLDLAVNFVATNMGVKRSGYLPYRGILAVLAYYFYHAPSSAITKHERDTLWDWFWRVTLSERYGSTSPSRMAEDAKRLRQLIGGDAVSFEYPFEITPESVRRTRMTWTRSALRNGTICMLAVRQPKNLKDGSPVNLADGFFSDLKRPERHHIFPVAYLRQRGITGPQVNLLPNFCFIPADLNKDIADRAPAEYLAEYSSSNPDFSSAANSHLLPVDAEASLWTNSFEDFIAERSELLAHELNRLVDRTPDEFGQAEMVALGDPLALKVDALEIALRDFIDNRLTAVAGPAYWRRTVPGDVIDSVRGRVDQRLSRLPYEDELQFASGRTKLDFCDVSDYEKILLKNWAHFGEFFGRKDELQRRMAAYRALRNAVQHNREAEDIERAEGEAAITWLERILDRYQETAYSLDEDTDEELTYSLSSQESAIEDTL